MSTQRLQDILPLVEKPSRYLGTEINSVHKDWQKTKLSIALAFPDLYEIGTSHFGLQILYHILNQRADTVAERVFAPATDMQHYLRAYGLPLMSLESHRPLKEFDIIGFSLLYELNYTNILLMLDLAQIPFWARDRQSHHPLIIGGGPCSCNPEPVADFFDAIVIGDGETVIADIAKMWINVHSGGNDKKQLLAKMAQIPGVYVPALYQVSFDRDGFQRIQPTAVAHPYVPRAIEASLDKAPFPDRPVIPFTKPVHDRLRLEVSRGCSRGCRFCQAGMIYRPVRERSIPKIVDLAHKALTTTGYEDISLLSLSTGDYGCLTELLQNLMQRYAPQKTAISLPSVRAGALTPELMRIIKQVRKTGFTIAPEAGSQRLRDVINKNISEQQIIDSVSGAFHLGWQVIKLYFMIGLPTETENDLHAIIDLVNRLSKIKGPGKRKGQINVSITTFIPKPHTPFQWASQLNLNASKTKIEFLRSALRKPAIHFKWQNPEISLLEGLFARGDRRLAQLLINAYGKGCQFDGWSDQFHFSKWNDALKETGIDLAFYTQRRRSRDEPLPWDHIHTGVEKSFLQQEWENAYNGETITDCRWGQCSGCGVCDFKVLGPVVYQQTDQRMVFQETIDTGPQERTFMKVAYSKTGNARFFGHLEMVHIFLRAIRRLNIKIAYSKGFHPKPKVSFEDPLPVGIESQEEHLLLCLDERLQPARLMQTLNQHLPEGIVVHDCQITKDKAPLNSSDRCAYRIRLKSTAFSEPVIQSFLTTSEAFEIQVKRKQKTKTINLKDVLRRIHLQDDGQLHLELIQKEGMRIRVTEILQHLFGLSDESIRLARILKVKN